ncbi:MAG: FMN-binding negative transcriptional regulator [Saprospiraceae bacterium]
MYIPPKYKITDINEVRNFIQVNSFGILVNVLDHKPWATHIPLELEVNADGEDVLLGHISKGNPQWQAFTENPQVMAIFSAPHAYISSSWYNHENVPTWNYIAVHVYGQLRVIEGEELYQSLLKLINKYEAASENPVRLEAMTPTYVAREMRGIVGFEIKITEIHAAKKLSQNRDEENFQNIITELEKRNEAYDKVIAEAMKNIK